MRRLGDCCGVAQPRQARLHSSRKLNVGQSRLLGWSGSMLLRLEQALRDASAHILTRVQGWERPRQAPHSIHTACTSAGAVRGRDSASATSPPPPQPTSRLSRDVCSDGCRRHRAPACARLRSPLQACQPMGAGCALRRRPRQPARAEAALSQCAWLPCSQPGTCGSLAVLLVRIRALCVPSHGHARTCALFSNKYAGLASLTSHVRPRHRPGRGCARAAAPRAAGPHGSARPPRAAAPLARRAKLPRRPGSELHCSFQRHGAARAAPDAPAAGVWVCLHARA
jgi:hypothetical protein